MSFQCFSAYYEDKDVCLQAACNTLCKDIKLPSTSIANSLLENEAAMQMAALILEIKYELKQSSERLLCERHLLLSAFCPMMKPCPKGAARHLLSSTFRHMGRWTWIGQYRLHT
jgi:hypothetical protein